MNLDALILEVKDYLSTIEVGADGENLWDNYQEITSISLRLQQIHNDIAEEEIRGRADSELKRFRTMIVDPTIERLDKLAAFESRKMTGKRMEWEMQERGL
jgi:hypothetical protein